MRVHYYIFPLLYTFTFFITKFPGSFSVPGIPMKRFCKRYCDKVYDFFHNLLSEAPNYVYRLHVRRIKERKVSASSNTVGGILRHLGARRKSNDARLERELDQAERMEEC